MLPPPYTSFPELTGNGVLLRRVLPSDLRELVEISFYDGVQAATINEAAVMQQRIDLDYQQGNSIHWAIVDTATGTVTGTCGYYRGFAGNTSELGFLLLPQYRGQGFMSKAIQLATTFGLNTIGLNRVIAITHAANVKAISLLQRNGFINVKALPDNELEFEYIPATGHSGS